MNDSVNSTAQTSARPPRWPAAVKRQVEQWLATASEHETAYPNAATLATCDGSGRVSARVMLVKKIDDDGLVFFTNSLSRKGHDLAVNPQAALSFHWKSLARQLRTEGRIEPISETESDAYFASRPRGSQLGAWASLQSQPMASANELTERLTALKKKYAGKPVPRPPHWFGYRLLPDYVEFWQEGEYRLHDRDVWRVEAGQWRREKRFP